jgi:hypothetical protein
MGYLPNLSDLTKVEVNIKLEFDTLDVVLIITTGGVGYLARALYRHASSKARRNVELQQENLFALIDEAQRRNAAAIFVRVHPDVSVFLPSGGGVEVIHRDINYIDYKIVFETN